MNLKETRIESENHSHYLKKHDAILFIVPIDKNEYIDFIQILIKRLESETLDQIAKKMDYLNELYEKYTKNNFELRYLRGMNKFIDHYDIMGNPIPSINIINL